MEEELKESLVEKTDKSPKFKIGGIVVYDIDKGLYQGKIVGAEERDGEWKYLIESRLFEQESENLSIPAVVMYIVVEPQILKCLN